MNNKAIIEFGFRRIWRILQISEGVIHLGLRPLWITPSLICRILLILLSLIQLLLNIPLGCSPLETEGGLTLAFGNNIECFSVIIGYLTVVCLATWPICKRSWKRPHFHSKLSDFLFGIRLLILHIKFQFSKSIKSSTFHIFLNLIYPLRKNFSFPKCPKITQKFTQNRQTVVNEINREI